MKLLLAVLLAIGCGSRATSHRCERPIAGLDAHLASGKLLWFGEMHGTEESPRLAGDAACQAAKRARVQLGLEIWTSEQPRFDRYLSSKGTAADRAALLEGAFWQQADGRSSQAMVALVEQVRSLRHAGAKIDIVLFDETLGERDQRMAQNVMKARDGKAIFVALSGNVHSRKTKGTRWDPDLVPAVAHLVAAKLPVVTFDVSARGGTMWACMATDDHEPVCGEHPMSDDGGTGAPWSLGPARDDSHDGVYFVGTTKASYPAVPAKS